MPYLIRTPEQIFREEGKDIYFIHFTEERARESPIWRDVQDWLATELPSVKVEMMASPEDSGGMSYGGDLRVDFSESDLATFCAQWETEEGGSIDPRFQCYLWPYAVWHEKHGHFIPSNEKPKEPCLTLWYDTPIGFIHHQISPKEAEMNHLTSHPGRPVDIWSHAVALWPMLAGLNHKDFPSGRIRPYDEESSKWIVLYENIAWMTLSDQRKLELLDWFCLPHDTEMTDPW
jgi:hypothetical protein